MKLELLIYLVSCDIEVVQYNVNITFIKNTCVNDAKVYREKKYIIGNANDEPTNFKSNVDQIFWKIAFM